MFVVTAGCERTVDPPALGEPRPELLLDAVTLQVYRKHTPQLLVRANHLELSRLSGALNATGAQFDFFVDGLTLDAPVLSGNLQSLSFDATGGVTFSSSHPDPSSRFVATTRSAHFEGKEGTRGVATGTEPIAVGGLQGGRPFSLEAQRFRFDVEAQHATFESVKSKVGSP